MSASWLWAALSEEPSKALLEILSRKQETVHHRVAAALALGRLEDGVRLYVREELWAEALLLARLRLPSRHPVVLQVYRAWAEDFMRRSRQDQAALCYLAVKDLGQALCSLEVGRHKMACWEPGLVGAEARAAGAGPLEAQWSLCGGPGRGAPGQGEAFSSFFSCLSMDFGRCLNSKGLARRKMMAWSSGLGLETSGWRIRR